METDSPIEDQIVMSTWLMGKMNYRTLLVVERVVACLD